jgi:hypothetical protein
VTRLAMLALLILLVIGVREDMQRGWNTASTVLKKGVGRISCAMKNWGSMVGAVFTLWLAASGLAAEGGLEEAPFRMIPESAGWQIEYSNKAMGEDVFLVATASNTEKGVKSVVVKAIVKKPSGVALEELCKGMRDSFANPTVKKTADEEVTFLGFKARKFVYVITQGGRSTYNEAVVFVSEGKGWTIASSGPQEQEAEVKRAQGLYTAKST